MASEQLTNERLRVIADAEYWPGIHTPMRLDAINMARELLALRAAPEGEPVAGALTGAVEYLLAVQAGEVVDGEDELSSDMAWAVVHRFQAEHYASPQATEGGPVECPEPGAVLKCLLCAQEKAWGTWQHGVAVCAECRDNAASGAELTRQLVAETERAERAEAERDSLRASPQAGGDAVSGQGCRPSGEGYDTSRDDFHRWIRRKRDTFDWCERCGIVRRTDDNNKPCPGRVRIALREKPDPDQSGTVLAPESTGGQSGPLDGSGPVAPTGGDDAGKIRSAAKEIRE